MGQLDERRVQPEDEQQVRGGRIHQAVCQRLQRLHVERLRSARRRWPASAVRWRADGRTVRGAQERVQGRRVRRRRQRCWTGPAAIRRLGPTWRDERQRRHRAVGEVVCHLLQRPVQAARRVETMTSAPAWLVVRRLTRPGARRPPRPGSTSPSIEATRSGARAGV